MNKVMYFTAADIPTVAELAAIAELRTGRYDVVIRTAADESAMMLGPRREECAFVSGSVPALYEDKPRFEPKGEGAIELGTALTIFDAETGQSAPTVLAAMPDETLGCKVPLHNVLLSDGQYKTLTVGSRANTKVKFTINGLGHLVTLTPELNPIFPGDTLHGIGVTEAPIEANGGVRAYVMKPGDSMFVRGESGSGMSGGGIRTITGLMRPFGGADPAIHLPEDVTAVLNNQRVTVGDKTFVISVAGNAISDIKEV